VPSLHLGSQIAPDFSVPPEVADRLRGGLEGAGFDESTILETLGVPNYGALEQTFRPLILERLDESPLAVLIRLFILRVEVASTLVRDSLGDMADDLTASGLLSIGDDCQALMRLVPQKGLRIVSDWSDRSAEGLRRDYVMGMSPSTLTTAKMIVGGSFDHLLDLGTGGGVLALLNAGRSHRIVATDLNERAIAVARLNSELNAVSNVDYRVGDTYEPVEGETFDAIISNPPYVISPDDRVQFMDNSLGAEEFCKGLIREAPRFLKDGGWCQLSCNWIERDDVDWRDHVASWLEGTGCDAHVLRFNVEDPADYATLWIRQASGDDPKMFYDRFPIWMDFMKRNRIDGVSMGFITMRSSTREKNWIKFEDAPGAPVSDAGEQIRRIFAAGDFLHSAGPDELLGATPLLGPGVKLEQASTTQDGRFGETTLRVSSTEGLPFGGGIDRHGAGVLANCDGRRTLRDLLSEMAGEMDVPFSKVSDAAVEAITGLLESGILVIDPALASSGSAKEP
jgi:predicted RNA methylase